MPRDTPTATQNFSNILSEGEGILTLDSFNRMSDRLRQQQIGLTLGGDGGSGRTRSRETLSPPIWNVEWDIAATPQATPTQSTPKFTSWREREEWMFSEGSYKPVPWANEPWAKRDECAHHYVHIAEKDPTMVAFIRAIDKAESKAPHVTLKPGRYLTKYFGDLLDTTAIQHWASQVRGDGTQLRFADDIATVKNIYAKSGLHACMSHGNGHYTGTVYSLGGKHPLEIYLLAGLRLAYITDAYGSITGRAFVWPEKMLHTRAYGDTQAITKALANAGYKTGLFDGLKLPAIPLSEDRGGDYRDCYLMPFIDHIKWAKKDSQTWSIPGVGVVESLMLSERATDATYYVQTTEAVAYPIASDRGSCWDTARRWPVEHRMRLAAESGIITEGGCERMVTSVVSGTMMDFGRGPEQVMNAEDMPDQEQPQQLTGAYIPSERRFESLLPLAEDFCEYSGGRHATFYYNRTLGVQECLLGDRVIALLPGYRLAANYALGRMEICIS